MRRIVCTPTAKQRGVKVDQIQHVFDHSVQEQARVAAEAILREGSLRFDKINAANLPDTRAWVDGATWGRRLFPSSFRHGRVGARVDELKRWEEAYPAATASPVEGLDRPYDGMASMHMIEAHCATWMEPKRTS